MLRNFCRAAFGCTALLSSEILAAGATSVASADNTLFQNDAGTLSNGSGSYFFVGTTATGLRRRGLLKFGVSSIPAGAYISSARLNLTLDRPEVGPYRPVSVHRAAQPWGEGTSNSDSPFNGGGIGVQATTGDATWAHRFYNTDSWTAPGGDFATAATDTFTPPDAGGTFTTEPSTLLAADVQAWRQNPSTNFGWLFKLADESTGVTAQRYGSRNNATEAARPRLLVTYQIAGDVTADDSVNLNDFTVLAANFGTTGRSFSQGDFTFDGSVNLDDFTILAAQFGATAGDTSRSSVPEPSFLAAVAALLPLARQRRLR